MLKLRLRRRKRSFGKCIVGFLYNLRSCFIIYRIDDELEGLSDEISDEDEDAGTGIPELNKDAENKSETVQEPKDKSKAEDVAAQTVLTE